MKRLISILALVIVSLTVSAQITVDNIYYLINPEKKTATVSNPTYVPRYSGHIVIPESIDYQGTSYTVTSIGDDAFENCESLQSVTLPNSIESILIDAFSGCKGLTSITLPDNLNTIGANAFAGCTGLTAIIIPNGVTSIPICAFVNCTSLTSVSFGKKVSYIDSNAFYGCDKIRFVTIWHTTPPEYSYQFPFTNLESTVLYVPKGCKSNFNNKKDWYFFKEIIEIDDETNIIPSDSPKGDINGDGNVDSDDINEIEKYIMGNPSPYFDLNTADVNDDGVVNVADIVCITKDKYCKYLTFVAIDDGKFKLSGNSVQYSLDEGSTWTTLVSDTYSPTLSAGQKIMWKGNLSPNSSLGIGTFSSTGRFNIEGNIMSLVYDDNFVGKTDLTEYGVFYGLFRECTKLINAKNLVLPATRLSMKCYGAMFVGCTSLRTAPELPSTRLGVECYFYMFDGCSSLSTAPILPATTLARYCYAMMFRNCTSLTKAPELPATTLANGSNQYMFSGCTSLNYIKCLATDISASVCTTGWVDGVSPSGTFVKASSMNSWTRGGSGIPTNWTVQDDDGKDDMSGKYLTFVALDNGTFKFTVATGSASIHYSLDDGSTWNTLASGVNSPSVSVGQKILWKGNLLPISSGICTFSSTGRFNVEGNAMSLLFGDNFVGETDLTGFNGVFGALFNGCANLISAEWLALPATTLARMCYASMFMRCTNLTTPPQLPATTLADYCYCNMFTQCESLTAPPALPATTLANHCYDGMFTNCFNLATAPELPATTLTEFCYDTMFGGCESLTIAPVLPATTLAKGCYHWMFYSCRKLNYIKCLATDISAPNCTTEWVRNVSSSGTFIKNSSISSWTRDVSGIPTNWTIQDDDGKDDILCKLLFGQRKHLDNTYKRYQFSNGAEWKEDNVEGQSNANR